MIKLDDQWLQERGRTVRPTRPSKALYERLKVVSSLIGAPANVTLSEPHILWRDDNGEVRSIRIGNGLLIGRDSNAGVQVSDPQISRRHCEVTQRDGRCWLHDLGSTNGTRLNGEPVQVQRLLRDGDLLQLGGMVFAFLAANTAQTDPPPRS